MGVALPSNMRHITSLFLALLPVLSRTAPVLPMPLADPSICTAPAFVSDGTKLSGTLFANDKSKGISWILGLDNLSMESVTLPLINGNHESDISPDGRYVALPHYEETTGLNQGEGGGSPGSRVSVLDITTGQASVLQAEGPNPFGNPKPHGAAWTGDNQLLVTAQLSNGIVKYGATGKVSKIDLSSTGCSTPHLVKIIAGTDLAVTGCRATNPGAAAAGKIGMLAVFNHKTNAMKALQSGAGSEGITVTKDGDIWVGALTGGTVSVFGWPAGADKTVDTLVLKTNFTVHDPIRLAYDSVNDQVGVACMNVAAVLDPTTSPMANSKLLVYKASDYTFVKSTVITTSRGRVNMEGLSAHNIGGKGYFWTGAFDSQSLVLLDALTLTNTLTVIMPRCSVCSKSTSISTAAAAAANMSGANNWSGGYCDATMRDPFDRRTAVFDGFSYSPLIQGGDDDSSDTDGWMIATIVLIVVVVIAVIVVIVLAVTVKRKKQQLVDQCGVMDDHLFGTSNPIQGKGDKVPPSMGLPVVRDDQAVNI